MFEILTKEIGIEGKYVITALSSDKTDEPPSNVNCSIKWRVLIAFGSNTYTKRKTEASNVLQGRQNSW
jgi:hypothetical protein